MQAAIFCGVMWLWAQGPDPDRGPFHVAVLAGVFLAYTFTFCTLMLVELVALVVRKVRGRPQTRQPLSAASGSSPVPAERGQSQPQRSRDYRG